MADDQAQPTEEQVKAANEAEFKSWDGDFKEEDLVIPYKRESSEEKKADEPAKDEAKADEPVVEEEVYADPEPVVTLEDPGDFTPNDYSFEIIIDGKAHKVSSVDDAEKLAQENAENLDAKQIITLMSKATRIDIKTERDKEEWQKSKDAYTKQVEAQNERQSTVDNLANEFEYLVSEGALPAVAAEYKGADWSDPEVAKQPGVKEQIELLNYMVKTNQKRAKANIKPITSVVDAFNAMQADKGRKTEADTTKAAGEARKAAGARVASVSAAQQGSYVPKGIAVGDPNKLKRSEAIWDN